MGKTSKVMTGITSTALMLGIAGCGTNSDSYTDASVSADNNSYSSSNYDADTSTNYDSSTNSSYDSSTGSDYDSSTNSSYDSSTDTNYDSSTESSYDSSTDTNYDSSTDSSLETDTNSNIDTNVDFQSDDDLPPMPEDPNCTDWEWDQEDGVWQCADSGSGYYGHSYYGGRYYSDKSLLYGSKDYMAYKNSNFFKGGISTSGGTSSTESDPVTRSSGFGSGSKSFGG